MHTRWSLAVQTSGLAFVLALSVALLPGCGGDSDSTATAPELPLSLKVLSSRPDLVTGGDALVEVIIPSSMSATAIRVSRDGADVTAKFSLRSSGRFVGLVDGLTAGENQITASAQGARSSTLVITNHKLGGPLFSGPQLQPWLCNTVEEGLGDPLDLDCSAPTKVQYMYMPAAGNSFQVYDPTNPPIDVKMIATDTGATVPYVVRRERGTLNRGIYEFAILTTPGATAVPGDRPIGWNGKLFYLFFGGMQPQYRQGVTQPPYLPEVFYTVMDDRLLSKGYAVAKGSLNVFANNTNSVVSAETVTMVKERIIKEFGEIRFTLSSGDSGGSMQQHMIANAYPGILDGIIPGASFADSWTLNAEVQDCSLLQRYFDLNASLWPSETEMNAVMVNADGQVPGTCKGGLQFKLDTGNANPASGSCYNLEFAVLMVGPTPVPWTFDPVRNPSGARCTLHDYQRAMLGTRAIDGYANSPNDNEGVQYGLTALQSGAISAEQFVNLNESVGGRDINWQWTSGRSVADQAALTTLYKSGQMNLGDGLGRIPVVDVRYCDSSEVHSCYHSFATRARLKKTNGTDANHVMLMNPPGFAAPPSPDALEILDRWVSAIKADTAPGSDPERAIRSKPSDVRDACWIAGQKVTDASICAGQTPYFGNPKIGAGAPLASDVLKCQRRPLHRSDYPPSLTDGQFARLLSTFPSGVCDWTKESVGFERAVPWLTFSAGPGGAQLPPVAN